MSEIRTLIDRNTGKPFVPQTHIKAVVDDNGNSIEDKFADIENRIVKPLPNSGNDTKNAMSQKAISDLTGMNSVPEFSELENYKPKDIVRKDGLLYEFTKAHNSKSWDGTDVKPTDMRSVYHKSKFDMVIDNDGRNINDFRNDVNTKFNGNIEYNNLSEPLQKRIDAGGQGITNLADGEDLENVTLNDTNVIREKTIKEYKPSEHSGMGKVILRKNIQPDGKNLLTQQMFQTEDNTPRTNTVYEIRYDFDLGGVGTNITIPDNCVLKFDGGSLSNGTLVGNNTIIEGLEKLQDVIKQGTFNYMYINTDNLAKTVGDREDVPMSQKAVSDALDTQYDEFLQAIDVRVIDKQDTLVSGENIATINGQEIINQPNQDLQLLPKDNVVQEDGQSPELVMSQKAVSDALKNLELPIATDSVLGGVKAKVKTEDMTEEVGVDELGKLFTKPITNGNTYVIELDRWGITSGYMNKETLGEDGLMHYSREQYDQMYNNGKGFTDAIKWASDNGYNGVVVPKNDYCFCCIQDLYRGASIIRPNILIQDILNFDINLGGSKFCYLIDSTEKSPYATARNCSGIHQPVILIFVALCYNVTVHDGELCGDRKIRLYIDVEEKYEEQGYGLLFSSFCFNNHVYNINAHDWMANGIKTVQLRYYFDAIGDVVEVKSITQQIPSDILDDAEAQVTNNKGIITYPQFGYEKTLNETAKVDLLNKKRYSISDFIVIKDELYKNDNFKIVKYLKNKGIYSISRNGGYTLLSNCYFTNIQILTFDDVSETPLRVIDCAILESFRLLPNETRIKIQTLNNDDLIPIHRDDIEYSKYASIGYQYCFKDNNEDYYYKCNVRSTKGIFDEIQWTKIENKYRFRTENTELWSKEKTYQKGSIVFKDSLDTTYIYVSTKETSIGKWIDNEWTKKKNIKEKRLLKVEALSISECISSNMLVENCYIHDNYRGGFGGSCNNMTIKNCTFVKHFGAEDNVPEIPGSTSFHINVEDDFCNKINIISNVFKCNDSRDGKILLGSLYISIMNNILDGCLLVIYNNHVTNICDNTLSSTPSLQQWVGANRLYVRNGLGYINRNINIQNNTIKEYTSIRNRYRNNFYQPYIDTIVKIKNNILINSALCNDVVLFTSGYILPIDSVSVISNGNKYRMNNFGTVNVYYDLGKIDNGNQFEVSFDESRHYIYIDERTERNKIDLKYPIRVFSGNYNGSVLNDISLRGLTLTCGNYHLKNPIVNSTYNVYLDNVDIFTSKGISDFIGFSIIIRDGAIKNSVINIHFDNCSIDINGINFRDTTDGNAVNLIFNHCNINSTSYLCIVERKGISFVFNGCNVNEKTKLYPSSNKPLRAIEGITANRPSEFMTAEDDGYQYFDTDLGKYIYYHDASSTKWIDALGAEV